MKDLWPPFWEGRGTASGDFDNDGDDDIVLASTDRGLSLFWNDGKGKFTAGSDFPANIRSLPIFTVASVDLNNDGWLDLVFTTYQLGNFVLWNDKGQFQRLQQIKDRPDAVLTQALSFGDIDKDGDLDVVFGHWSSGWYRRIPGLESTNRVVFNDGGTITGDHAQELDGMPGETLSVLLTDFNLDGNLDLIEANDFDRPTNVCGTVAATPRAIDVTGNGDAGRVVRVAPGGRWCQRGRRFPWRRRSRDGTHRR